MADGAGAAGSVRLSDAQRLLLEALAATGRPGSAVSSTELAKRTGLNRNSVRVYLMELRDKLGIDQAADIVQVARERGLLDPPASPAPDGAIG